MNKSTVAALMMLVAATAMVVAAWWLLPASGRFCNTAGDIDCFDVDLDTMAVQWSPRPGQHRKVRALTRKGLREFRYETDDRNGMLRFIDRNHLTALTTNSERDPYERK